MIIDLQDLDQTIAEQVAQEAQRHHLNLNEFILSLLKLGLLTWQQTEQPPYHDLDALAGTWSDEEADQFASTISDFSQIDESLWPSNR